MTNREDQAGRISTGIMTVITTTMMMPMLMIMTPEVRRLTVLGPEERVGPAAAGGAARQAAHVQV
jgi:hypothetical protein